MITFVIYFYAHHYSFFSTEMCVHENWLHPIESYVLLKWYIALVSFYLKILQTLAGGFSTMSDYCSNIRPVKQLYIFLRTVAIERNATQGW